MNETQLDLLNIGSFLPMLFAFGCTLGGMLLWLLFQNAERRRWHQTIRLALEKNQPLSSLPALISQVRLTSAQHRAFRFNPGLVLGGVINLMIGVGLCIAMLGVPGSGPAFLFVLIPAFVGAGLLFSSGILNLRFFRRRFR